MLTTATGMHAYCTSDPRGEIADRNSLWHVGQGNRACLVGPRGGDDYLVANARGRGVRWFVSGKGTVSGGRELVPGASMARVAWLPHGDGD